MTLKLEQHKKNERVGQGKRKKRGKIRETKRHL